MSHNPLPNGTKVADYEILRVIREDARHITYLAEVRDSHPVPQTVILQELFPKAICERHNNTIRAYSDSRARKQLETEQQKFASISKSVFQLTDPILSPAIDEFSQNGTEYRVFEHNEGQTYLQSSKTRQNLSPDLIGSLFLFALSGLEDLHQKNLIHGYITPSSLIRMANGYPKLIPSQEYRHLTDLRLTEAPRSEFSPWSAPEWLFRDADTSLEKADMYDLAASFMTLITGVEPRQLHEINDGRMQPFDFPKLKAAHPSYRKLISRIAIALEPDPKDRPTSIASWKKLYSSDIAFLLRPRFKPTKSYEMSSEAASPSPRNTPHVKRRYWPIAGMLAGVLAFIGSAQLLPQSSVKSGTPSPSIPTLETTVTVSNVIEKKPAPKINAKPIEQVLPINDVPEKHLSNTAWDDIDKSSAQDIGLWIYQNPADLNLETAISVYEEIDTRAWLEARAENTLASYSSYLEHFETGHERHGLFVIAAHRQIRILSEHNSKRAPN